MEIKDLYINRIVYFYNINLKILSKGTISMISGSKSGNIDMMIKYEYINGNTDSERLFFDENDKTILFNISNKIIYGHIDKSLLKEKILSIYQKDIDNANDEFELAKNKFKLN